MNQSINESNQLKTKNQKPKTSITIFCDGASRGNPGPAAAAFVVVGPQDQVVHQLGEFLGQTTNNVAEYRAVLLALSWLQQYLETSKPGNLETVLINLDSELLYKQIIGEYRVKALHLVPLHQQIQQQLQWLRDHQANVQFQHQLRSHNHLADQLCNQILDQQVTQ